MVNIQSGMLQLIQKKRNIFKPWISNIIYIYIESSPNESKNVCVL
jgi:hypothetical protein